jgi:lipopolysaccharide heptosyltransferase I
MSTDLQVPAQTDSRPTRILIVRLSALGDVCHAVPSAVALRKAYPDAHIGWIVETAQADIVRARPEVNSVHVLPRKEWQKAMKNPLLWPKIWISLRRTLRELREENYDWAIDFQGNMRSAFITRGSKAPNRVGWDDERSKEGASRSYTHTVKGAYLQKADEDLHMLRELGIETSRHTEGWNFSAEAVADVDAYINGRSGFVLLHPGVSAFGAYKQWPLERYQRLAGQLKAAGHEVLISHGPGEKELAERVGGELLPDGWDLMRLGSLISHASCVVGSDTGPVHFADAIGVPAVGLYGPKDPERYGLVGEKSVMIYRDEVPCRPCTLRTCDDPICMRWIDERDVFAAVEAVLSTEN